MIDVIRFDAHGCAKCQFGDRLYQTVAKDYTGRPDIKFAEIDVDKHLEIAEKYEIQSVPVIIIERDGKVIDRIEGIVPENRLRERIEAAYGER